MAQLSNFTGIFSGDTTVIDTTQKHKFNTRAYDVDGNEYLYVKGITSGALGRWVTFDENGVTALLLNDAVGPVGVMMSVLDADTDFGWICIFGECEASMKDGATTDLRIGYKTTSGYADDTPGAGDTIYRAVLRDTISGGDGNGTVQIFYPFVDDNSN